MNSATVLKFPRQRPAEQVAPRPVETPVVTPIVRNEALELYPECAGLFARLRRCGIRRVYGPFTVAAWRETCACAQLYSLPLDRRARADLSRIRADAKDLAHSLGDHAWALGSPEPHIFTNMIAAHGEAGDLARLIFPNHGEATGGELVTVSFPQPPAEFMPAMHGARLAGLEIGVAMPASAICNVELAGQAPMSRAMRDMIGALMVQHDPIVYGRDRATEHVVGLGHYNASPDDPETLKTLIAVLESMGVDL